MKKMLYILFLLIPLGSFAQQQTDTLIAKSPNSSLDPLYVIDGIPVFDGEVKITGDEIEDLYILRDPSEKGLSCRQRSAVIVIRTKKEEHKIIVLDPGFESFLATQKSKDFYSIQSLKNKNIHLVSEWNIRCSDPLRYDPKIYETKIDYESSIDYGLDVEYTLYMFFKFMEKENGLIFNSFAKL